MSLDFDPRGIRIPATHMIGGKAVCGLSEKIAVNRPSDLQPLSEIEDGGVPAVARAVEAAKARLKISQWARCQLRGRARVLFRWVEQNGTELWPRLTE